LAWYKSSSFQLFGFSNHSLLPSNSRAFSGLVHVILCTTIKILSIEWGRTPGLGKFNTACLRIQTLFKKQKPHEHLSEGPVHTGIHMAQRCVVDLFMITSSKYAMKFHLWLPGAAILPDEPCRHWKRMMQLETSNWRSAHYCSRWGGSAVQCSAVPCFSRQKHHLTTQQQE